MQPSVGIRELDLHRKTAAQARYAINAALNSCGSEVYRLRLIHGFNGGRVLHDMVWSEYAKHPKVKRLVSVHPGATDLVLRELYEK